MRKTVILFVLSLLFISPGVLARSRRSKASTGSSTAGAFDYYLLSLSWAPTWCGLDPSRATTAECSPAKHVGFVVHGFWPQSESGRGPENCGAPSRVSPANVKIVLPLMLSANLIQHEWATHGTCSGLNQYDYFTALVKARSSVQIPVQLNAAAGESSLTPAEIEAQFAGANSAFPKQAFRVACTRGELEEVRVCFDKNISPRACAASLTDCRDSKLQIPPTL